MSQIIPETGFVPAPKVLTVVIPETGFVRLALVLIVIPVKKSCWWAGVKSGRFPPPVKVSERCTAWRAEDIHLLIKQIYEQAIAKQRH